MKKRKRIYYSNRTNIARQYDDRNEQPIDIKLYGELVDIIYRIKSNVIRHVGGYS